MNVTSVPDPKLKIMDLDPLNENKKFQIRILFWIGTLPQIIHDIKKKTNFVLILG